MRKASSLAKLGAHAHDGGKFINKLYTLTANGTDLTEEFFNNDGYPLVMHNRLLFSALSAHVAREIFQYIVSCPMHKNPRVKPGKAFWRNFHTYVGRTTHFVPTIWNEGMEKRLLSPGVQPTVADIHLVQRRKLGVLLNYFQPVGKDDSLKSNPDFILGVHIVAKLLKAAEERYLLQFGTEITESDFEKILEHKSFALLIMEIMMNSQGDAYRLFNAITGSEQEITDDSIDDFFSSTENDLDPKSFKIDPETFEFYVDPEVVESVRRDLAEIPSTNLLRKNCPIIYAGFYYDLFTWIKTTFMYHRFGKTPPPESYSTFEGTEQQYLAALRESLQSKLAEIYRSNLPTPLQKCPVPHLH